MVKIEAEYKKAQKIYQRHLKSRLEKRYKGRIVAIEVDSGDYFIGKDEIEAYDKARAKHPADTFCFLRIGYRATHFVGAF